MTVCCSHACICRWLRRMIQFKEKSQKQARHLSRCQAPLCVVLLSIQLLRLCFLAASVLTRNGCCSRGLRKWAPAC